MPLETAWFLAGVGVMVTLDLATFGAIVHLADKVGEDSVARKRSQRALERANEARQSGNGD